MIQDTAVLAVLILGILNKQVNFKKPPKIMYSQINRIVITILSENFVECGAVKKIQYFPCSTNKAACSVLVNLNSACMRCETCLLIANQIAQTLSALHKQTFPKNNFDETQLKSAITFICDHSFQNYGLKDVDGKRVVFDYLPTANEIFTNVDGQWDTHLKQRCHELTEALGATKLHETWKLSRADARESTKLETAMCRQENAFLRDCRGIPMAERHNFVSQKNQRLAKRLISLIQHEETPS